MRLIRVFPRKRLKEEIRHVIGRDGKARNCPCEVPAVLVDAFVPDGDVYRIKTKLLKINFKLVYVRKVPCHAGWFFRSSALGDEEKNAFDVKSSNSGSILSIQTVVRFFLANARRLMRT